MEVTTKFSVRGLKRSSDLSERRFDPISGAQNWFFGRRPFVHDWKKLKKFMLIALEKTYQTAKEILKKLKNWARNCKKTAPFWGAPLWKCQLQTFLKLWGFARNLFPACDIQAVQFSSNLVQQIFDGANCEKVVVFWMKTFSISLDYVGLVFQAPFIRLWTEKFQKNQGNSHIMWPSNHERNFKKAWKLAE